MKHIIKNFDELATNTERIDALSIIEAGYEAIDTTLAVKKDIFLKGSILHIKEKLFDLDNYKRIFIIGFGKASSKAVGSIEDVLEGRITDGIVIDKDISDCCRIVKIYKGTHPLPSKENVVASQKIVELATQLKEDDLVLVVVSGGGSALLCYPMSEYEQGQELYKKFLHTGGTIEELNILRKHLSEIKGGGLAKLLYPANVLSLIFCDVPGNDYENTASGPTYFDRTTIRDAEKLLEKYAIKNTFSFIETPKDEKYFKKVINIPFISNAQALIGMENKAKDLGYEIFSLGGEIYTSPGIMLERMKQLLKDHSVVIAGGELAVTLKKEESVSGRNLFTCGQALRVISDGDVFISFATDGIDNLSSSAGAIIDKETKRKIKESDNLIIMDSADKDLYDEIFTSSGDRIMTGPTGSNVSDLYLMLRK
jgi:glycerate-2-kinase